MRLAAVAFIALVIAAVAHGQPQYLVCPRQANYPSFSDVFAICAAATPSQVTYDITTPAGSYAASASYTVCYNDQSNGICVDQCVLYSQSQCMNDAHCMLVPGSGSALNCISKGKICTALSNSNSTWCNLEMCKYSSSTCGFAPPVNPTAGPGTSVADKCPALHPAVIAGLVLMILTFVIAVAVVVVVVVRNQKKFDEEEARREQAAAAAAEAKRARQSRH